jgi:hypothetical protein
VDYSSATKTRANPLKDMSKRRMLSERSDENVRPRRHYFPEQSDTNPPLIEGAAPKKVSKQKRTGVFTQNDELPDRSTSCPTRPRVLSGKSDDASTPVKYTCRLALNLRSCKVGVGPAAMYVE